MRFPVSLLLGFVATAEVLCVPISVLNNEISVSSEEADDISPPVLEDDITTRGLARLSSAATCLVAGVEYTHGQQIYRADQCEFCLCLDGEMFCWWQDCPPTMEGPCKNQGPFSPRASVAAAAAPKPETSSTSSQFGSTIRPPSTTKDSSKLSRPQSSMIMASTTAQTPTDDEESTSLQEDSTAYTEDDDERSETENSTEMSGRTDGPKSCIVMGQEYREGDDLPHSTGNCLECVCGEGGKITCSPHQCVPAEDEITDYHQQGARQGNDVF